MREAVGAAIRTAGHEVPPSLCHLVGEMIACATIHSAKTDHMIPSTTSGIVVQNAIAAGGANLNHAEGIVVGTAPAAGSMGTSFNHSECLVG